MRYDHSTGRYVTIRCRDDDGLFHLRSEAQRIIDATGQLMTWRISATTTADWPSAMRNERAIGSVPSKECVAGVVCIHAAEGQYTRAHCHVRVPARFAVLLLQGTRRIGAGIPVVESSIFRIQTSPPRCTCSPRLTRGAPCSDGPVTFTTYSDNSNSAIVLGRKKRNTQRTEAFYGDFSSPLYAHVPLKSNLIWQRHCGMRLADAAFFDLPPELKAFDDPNALPHLLSQYRVG